MHISQRKEQFSNAYIQAVATVAGYWLSKPTVDDDSVDCIIGGKGTGSTRPRVEVQLKCTETLGEHAVQIPFRLSKKNYEDLRAVDLTVPRILVVVAVPEQLLDWLELNDQHLVMRRCGYWTSLYGLPDRPKNEASVTVQIPRANLFTPQALQGIMERVARKEAL